MLNSNQSENKAHNEMELICMDLLVPQDHLLRLIDKYVDFSFIREKVRPYYSETKGRPALDPVVLFKMMLIGYLYGIRSERQLEQEIIPNAAYRWFLGLRFSDRVPDHSTISWNRNNRFKDTNLFQEIFDEMVHLAINHKMVDGRLLVTDSTHIRANANNNRYTMQVLEETPHDYLKELEKAINEDRENHGKKPLPPRKPSGEEKPRKVSQTDPECGLMKRSGKPEAFCYLDHRTVDHKYNIITDVHVTPGHVNDAAVYVERLKRQIQTFAFQSTLEAVALDSGYMTPYICDQTLKLEIAAAIAERNAPTPPDIFPKKQFIYHAEENGYLCPAGKMLMYTTTNRQGYREYTSNAQECANCPLLNQCTKSANHQRKIERHIWEESKEKVAQYRKTHSGEAAYKLRPQTIERSFADAKELHGYRRCKFRGRAKTQEQAFMTAIAQNVKKIARYLAQKVGRGQKQKTPPVLLTKLRNFSKPLALNSAA
ncbi:IS1182 family transposase [Paenibacillus apiarius]|uniref:IS1182 family transposase n=1 Tax=Paenibacillus apiarius TaxID=46240 RepID=UPI003B3B5113